MKFGHLAGPGRVELTERPTPTAGPGEVVVELAACGVCGTDLEKLRGNYQTAGLIGHEPAAGSPSWERASPVSRWATGCSSTTTSPVTRARSALEETTRSAPHTRRPTSTPAGSPSRSGSRPRTSLGRRSCTWRTPSDWDAGALLEPAGCALTAIRRVGLPEHPTAFVLGLGPVGLLYARLLKSMGAAWVGGTEVSPLRRKAAERGGIDLTVDPREPGAAQAAVQRATAGRGVDLAVVAVGHTAVARDATTLVRRGGTVNLFGLPESGSRLDADLQDLYLRGIRVIPSYATTEPDLVEVHRRVASGDLRISDLVTHRIPLARIDEAFRWAARPDEAVKVTVTGSAA